MNSISGTQNVSVLYFARSLGEISLVIFFLACTPSTGDPVARPTSFPNLPSRSGCTHAPRFVHPPIHDLATRLRPVWISCCDSRCRICLVLHGYICVDEHSICVERTRSYCFSVRVSELIIYLYDVTTMLFL
jgi:hypothetical protein